MFHPSCLPDSDIFSSYSKFRDFYLNVNEWCSYCILHNFVYYFVTSTIAYGLWFCSFCSLISFLVSRIVTLILHKRIHIIVIHEEYGITTNTIVRISKRYIKLSHVWCKHRIFGSIHSKTPIGRRGRHRKCCGGVRPYFTRRRRRIGGCKWNQFFGKNVIVPFTNFYNELMYTLNANC
jgi:hypothetical protein